MKSIFCTFLVISTLLVATTTQVSGQQKQLDAHHRKPVLWTVSIIQLIAHPEMFDSVSVSVQGFFHWRDEDVALYYSKEDADFLCSANALWLKFSDSVRRIPLRSSVHDRDTAVDIGYFDGKHITVRGVFCKDERGNGTYAGALVSVEVILEDRKWSDGRRELWRLGTDGKTLEYLGP